MSIAEDAIAKLRAEEKKGNYDRAASVMKGPVRQALESFCQQDEEFAEAVAQGGSFAECMAAVARGAGQALSDLEAYKRAASFYFKGSDVQMQLRIELAGEERAAEDGTSEEPRRTLPARRVGPYKKEGRKPIVLDLEDFL